MDLKLHRNKQLVVSKNQQNRIRGNLTEVEIISGLVTHSGQKERIKHKHDKIKSSIIISIRTPLPGIHASVHPTKGQIVRTARM